MKPRETPDSWDIRACATCGVVLLIITTDAGTRYAPPPMAHTIGAPHAPVPVLPMPGLVIYRCDFCSSPNPVFAIDVQTFETHLRGPGGYHTGSVGGWAACMACFGLIHTGAWEDLITRAVRSIMAGYGVTSRSLERDYTRELRKVYRTLRKNIVGPPHLIIDPHNPIQDDDDQ